MVSQIKKYVKSCFNFPRKEVPFILRHWRKIQATSQYNWIAFVESCLVDTNNAENSK